MEYNIIGSPGISMGLFSEHGPCLEHDHETLRPIIVSTWMPEKVGGLPGKSLVFAESQVNHCFGSGGKSIATVIAPIEIKPYSTHGAIRAKLTR